MSDALPCRRIILHDPTVRLQVACADLEAKPLFWTEGGTRQGFEPDVADLVFGEAELPFDWVFLQWSDFLPSVAQGRMDAVLCGQGWEGRQRVEGARAIRDSDLRGPRGSLVGRSVVR